MEDFGAAQKVQEQERIQRALKAFQDAARNRTKDPDTFEAAKTRYYFLTKGPEWLAQEKRRILTEKVDPIVANYRDQFNALDSEEKVQSAYTDSIAAIRDKQDSIRGSAERQTSFFQRMIETQQAEKSAFDRIVELTTPTSAPQPEAVSEEAPLFVQYFAGYPSSFRILLDVLLGVVVFFILFLGLRKTRLATMGSFFSTPPPRSFFSAPATAGPGIFISTPAFGPTRTAVLNPR